MEWLMNITDIVDKKTHGCRNSIFDSETLVKMFHDLTIHVALIVAFLLIEPVADAVDGLSDVVCILGEVEVFKGTTLVKVWLVNKMPTCLPSSSMPFDVISERSAFHHWVVTFILDNVSIILFKDSESIVHFPECVWICLIKDVVSDSSNEQMSLATPGLDLADN